VRLHIEYAHTLDPHDWQRRHAHGLVPDRLPYGLDRLADHGFELVVRPAAHRRLARGLDRLARRISGGFQFADALRDKKRRGCDAVLCWDERTGVPAALRSGLPGEPPVVSGVIWITDEDAPLGPTGRALASAALRRARAVYAMSPAQIDFLVRDWGVRRDRAHLMDMGIDAQFWQDGGTLPDPEVVVGAGNDRHRDHGLLVEALRTVQRRRPSVRLELATHHPVQVPAEVGRRYPSLAHPAMRELYARASVVALALKENLHLSGLSVLLEAMACARPVVVSNTSGMSEYVSHGQNGLLVPPGDADELARAVEELLNEPERARALGQAGRESVETRFSTERQASRLADIIRAAAA
jgi:glycosyltransferase involved in cell wall biosynthesis